MFQHQPFPIWGSQGSNPQQNMMQPSQTQQFVTPFFVQVPLYGYPQVSGYGQMQPLPSYRQVLPSYGQMQPLPSYRQMTQSFAYTQQPPASNIVIPSVKNGEFNRFFDSLTVAELDYLWQIKDYREKIEDRLRAPGSLHEWFLVSQAPIFKRWGVTAEDIRENRTLIKEVKFKNPPGEHGGRGSTEAHNQLINLINKSSSCEEYIIQLNNWADSRLVGGRTSLPKKLQR